MGVTQVIKEERGFRGPYVHISEHRYNLLMRTITSQTCPTCANEGDD